ncbi:MAG TPA: aminotransferase class V-fold PLP-dependent enzyme [Blastocatellia bacterium]|nr:aminotransferase class V-fold PLP-dependent enzyme [Blastocatellia bacterium]
MSQFLDSDSANLPLQRHLFEIPDGVVYLNCANLSPQLRSVTAAGLNSVAAKRSPWEITAPDWFSGAEALRELAAKVVGTSAESIALVPSVSYGIAVAAANVPVGRGQSIVLLHEEYPSNYYAWRELARREGADIRIVRRANDGTWTRAVVEAIDDRTAVVSVPNCHWTDGSLIDLEKVGERVRVVGAALVIDASQSLGAYPLDIRKVQPDFLVSVGYKWLMGPYALGYLYAAPKWQAGGRPIENSWLSRAGSENFARLVDYRDEFRTGARRFDMGEFPNFALVPMAIAALQQILEWKVENIRQTLSALTGLIAAEAAKLGCTSLPARDRVDHMIGVRLPNGIPAGLGERLAEAKVFVSIRGDAMRIAPHLYNDGSDIEKFFAVLRKLI